MARAIAKDFETWYQSMADLAKDPERAGKTIRDRERDVQRLYMEVRALDEIAEEEKAMALLDRILTLAPRHVAGLLLKEEIERRRKPSGSPQEEDR